MHIKTFFFPFILLFLVAFSACENAGNNEPKDPETEIVPPPKPIRWTERPAWDSAFSAAGVNGTFILHKEGGDEILYHDSARARKGFIPASTFKIPNSLIFLETGVVDSVEQVLKWDGENRGWEKWDRDQRLDSAIRYSCVWYYQEMARRVGEERMQHYLDTLRYGNATMGTAVDLFWLEGSLRISAEEQIEFLGRLIREELPASRENQQTVKKIMQVDEGPGWRLHAKTGWGIRLEPGIGWYVGYVMKGDEHWIFAMNIDIEEDNQIRYRQDISYEILSGELGLNMKEE